MAPQRAFRVFVSSTFDDLKLERNALDEHVFPRLKQYCESRGFSFQAIDLRWGVSDEAALDHRAIDTCLEEISRCQQSRLKPNFLILLGDRYGWRPLPTRLSTNEFDIIAGSLKAIDKDEFHFWYPRDENAVPAAYYLRPRRNTTGDSKAERETWKETEQRLWNHIAASHLPPERLMLLRSSATEVEILRGVLGDPEAAPHVGCFVRRISNLEQADRHFVDKDAEAIERLGLLKSRLESALGASYRSYEARWTGKGLSTGHLETLCDDIFEFLKASIQRQIDQSEEGAPDLDESAVHSALEEEMGEAESFVGRQREFGILESYLLSEDRRPLLIAGEPGSGLTTTLARFIRQARRRLPNARFVGRFIATTSRSSQIRTLLEDLCTAVSRALDDRRILPDDIPALVENFAERLALADTSTPLIVFIDGLDQLADDAAAPNLSWLPNPLPDHVRLIATGPPGSLPSALELPLSLLSAGEVSMLLSSWLARAGRQLTVEQRHSVEASSKGNPLALKVAFGEASHWRSTDPAGPICDGLTGVLERLFARLEDGANHGEPLVRRCLGNLAIARFGLSEEELLELLGATEVLEDLRRRSPESPPVGHLPTVVWARLYGEISPFLSIQAADGVQLLNVRTIATKEAIRVRYFSTPVAEALRHQDLAQFFQGKTDPHGKRTWDGATKRGFRELPYHLYQIDSLRDVADQICALAQQRAFWKAQFRALRDARPCLEVQDFALARAIKKEDLAAIIVAVADRHELNDSLQRTIGFQMFTKVAESDPELGMALAASMGHRTNRPIAMTLVAWLLSASAHRDALCRRAIDRAIGLGTAVGPHQVGFLLGLMRDLAERGFPEAERLTVLMPDCPIKRAATRAWEHGSSATLAGLSSSLKQESLYSVAKATIVRDKEIENYANKIFESNGFNENPGQIEEQIARRFGRDGPEIAYFSLAKRMLWVGDIEIAVMIVNRALYISNSFLGLEQSLRTRLALMRTVAAFGNLELAAEFRAQAVASLTGRHAFFRNRNTTTNMAPQVLDIVSWTNSGERRGDWTDSNFWALAEVVRKAVAELRPDSPTSWELRLHESVRLEEDRQHEAARIVMGQLARDALPGRPHATLLLAMRVVGELISDEEVVTEIRKQSPHPEIIPDALGGAVGAEQTRRSFDALCSASPSEVEAVAMYMRTKGGGTILFPFLEHLCMRGANPNVIDACMSQVVRTVQPDGVDAAVNAFVRKDRAFGVAQGLGSFYFRPLWELLLGVGLLFLVLGRTSYSEPEMAGVFGLFGVLGAWLDLSIWKRSNLWARPEISRRWGLNGGSMLCLWAAVFYFETEWPRLVNADGVGYGATAVVACALGVGAAWAAVTYIFNFPAMAPRWRVVSACVVAGVAICAVASKYVSEMMGEDWVTGFAIGGAALWAVGLNILLKSIRVRRHYADLGIEMRGEADELGLVDDKPQVPKLKELSATTKVMRAQRARGRGSPAKAYRLYSEAADDPTRVELSDMAQGTIFLMRGMMSRELGNSARAVSDYEQAIALNPRSPSAYLNSALVFAQELHQPKRALAMFDLAIEHDPTEPDTYSSRGLVKNDLIGLHAGIEDFDRALDIDPDHVDAMVNKGGTLMQLGDRSGALALWDRALELRPDPPLRKLRDRLRDQEHA